MLEARKDINEVLAVKDVQLVTGVKLPDFALSSSQTLWMEMENHNWARLLIPFFNGLLYAKTGSIKIAGKDFYKVKNLDSILSCIFVSANQAGSISLNSLVHWIAYKKKINPAQTWSNCKRILEGMGCEYICQTDLQKMSENSLKKISTAITLSIPRLLMILNDPFLSLELDGKINISNEISNLVQEGSSIIIMSQDSPYCKFDRNIFLGTIL